MARENTDGGLGELYNVNKTSGSAQVYHTDGLGSVRAITDTSSPNALVIQTYRTDEFGIPDPSGTMGASTQSLQYTGEQRDAESNFMYLRARMYDPTIGRFMQADPVRKSGSGVSGWNRYSYVANNPVTEADPSGLIVYFVRGIGPGGISQDDRAFIRELEPLVSQHVSGMNGIFSGSTREENAFYVADVTLHPENDSYASMLHQRVLKDRAAGVIAPGESINFVAVSGGATVAFHAADLLNGEAINVGAIATIGGWVVGRAKPQNVGRWGAVVSVRDLAWTHTTLIDEMVWVNEVTGHSRYFTDPSVRGKVEQAVVQILNSGTP